MKREGRGRRGGVEMRKGIIVGGMIIGLLMGCNNGGEDPQKVFLKSVVSLGNNFLDVFTSFGEMFSSSLGFKGETKKSDVANYFKKVQSTLEKTKTALDKIVSDMKREGNPNASGTEAAVKTLVDNKIEKIIAGAKKVSDAIGEGVNDEVGTVVNGGKAAKPTGVDSIIGGIKEIVDIVLKTEGNHQAGTDNRAYDGTARTNNTGAAHLFIKLDTASDAKKAAGDASKAVGAVTGADILRAIHSEGKVKTLAENEHTSTADAANQAKDALIAGALAVRGMAKEGKFATANNGTDAKDEIKNAVANAIKMALSTLNIAIMRTIDVDLKAIKDAMKLDSVVSDTEVLK